MYNIVVVEECCFSLIRAPSVLFIFFYFHSIRFEPEKSPVVSHQVFVCGAVAYFVRINIISLLYTFAHFVYSSVSRVRNIKSWTVEPSARRTDVIIIILYDLSPRRRQKASEWKRVFGLKLCTVEFVFFFRFDATNVQL